MISIAVCDDDDSFTVLAESEIGRILNSHHILHRIARFTSGPGLLAAGSFDLVFLDIEMSGMDGMELARTVRSRGEKCLLIFLTSYSKYVLSAFDVEAYHYLLKPVNPQKLEEVLLRSTASITEKKQSYYTMRTEKGGFRIPFCNILYFEVLGRRISVHTHKDTFSFNGRLEEVEGLVPETFYRCHRSYLVNLSCVCRYEHNDLLLVSGDKIPLSRRKTSEFGKLFLSHLCGEDQGDV